MVAKWIYLSFVRINHSVLHQCMESLLRHRPHVRAGAGMDMVGLHTRGLSTYGTDKLIDQLRCP